MNEQAWGRWGEHLESFLGPGKSSHTRRVGGVAQVEPSVAVVFDTLIGPEVQKISKQTSGCVWEEVLRDIN